jgi:glycosyltransferase involved in cell wall biosynthesis
VVIPAFNEALGIETTLNELVAELARIRKSSGTEWEVIIVDDASTDSTAELLGRFHHDNVRVVRNAQNRGYGASLKEGIAAAAHQWILITDADGTYPASHVSELLESITPRSMAVGARTGPTAHVAWIRRPAKWFLTRLASYLSGVRILDMNSGFRLFSKDLFQPLERLLPDGFSFTSTITIAALSSGWKIHYLPIGYRKRSGRSKIRPIRDTIGFFTLILRTVLYFDPLRVFIPFALISFLAAAGVAVGSLFFLDRFMDTTTVVLLTTSVQLLALGVIADMINRRLR